MYIDLHLVYIFSGFHVGKYKPLIPNFNPSNMTSDGHQVLLELLHRRKQQQLSDQPEEVDAQDSEAANRVGFLDT